MTRSGSRIVWVVILVAGTLAAQLAEARPEYSAQQGLACVKCHATPWGGGPRTVLGKIFGSHGYEASPYSQSSLYYGDLRWIAFAPERAVEVKNGFATMEAAVSGNVPISEPERDGELRAVATFDASPLAQSLRESYVRWQPDAGQTQLLVGRIYAPFGLLTDEHRTYSRIQSASTLNQFDTGIAISHEFSDGWQADLAGFNDLSGTGLFSDQDINYAGVANLRKNFHDVPLLVGASASRYRSLRLPDPQAYSGYFAVWPLAELSLSGEAVFTRNWGDGANPFRATYFGAAGPGDEWGYFGKLTYWIQAKWAPYYRVDHLDEFTRHGIGLEAFLASNLILNARYEFAVSQAAVTPRLVDLGGFLAMLRLWI